MDQTYSLRKDNLSAARESFPGTGQADASAVTGAFQSLVRSTRAHESLKEYKSNLMPMIRFRESAVLQNLQKEVLQK